MLYLHSWARCNLEMLSLICCRRTSLTAPFVRNVVESTCASSRYLVSWSRSFSSIESVDGSDKFQHKGKETSFVVSYLVSHCRFSLESAKSRAKYIYFSSPERPDAILKMLKEYGFTLNQINKVVMSFPQILTSSADEILLPKLQFLGTLGLLGAEMTKLITSCPRILAGSLQNRLIPSYQALTSVLTPDDITRCLKRNSRLLLLDMQKHLTAKVSLLSRYGVPEKHARKLIRCAPRLMTSPSAHKFEGILKRVVELGFEPTQMKFLYAIAVLSQLNESTWKLKMSIYESFGWSEDDILQAFRVNPSFMSYSEKKIRSVVDFYVNKVGLSTSFFLGTPMIIGLSLEKRIKPRCRVMVILLSAGVLKNDTVNYGYILKMSEKQFMDRFVIKYCERVPQLLNIFQGKSVSISSGNKF